jgi:hypothetical protein
MEDINRLSLVLYLASGTFLIMSKRMALDPNEMLSAGAVCFGLGFLIQYFFGD